MSKRAAAACGPRRILLPTTGWLADHRPLFRPDSRSRHRRRGSSSRASWSPSVRPVWRGCCGMSGTRRARRS